MKMAECEVSKVQSEDRRMERLDRGYHLSMRICKWSDGLKFPGRCSSVRGAGG